MFVCRTLLSFFFVSPCASVLAEALTRESRINPDELCASVLRNSSSQLRCERASELSFLQFCVNAFADFRRQCRTGVYTEPAKITNIRRWQIRVFRDQSKSSRQTEQTARGMHSYLISSPTFVRASEIFCRVISRAFSRFLIFFPRIYRHVGGKYKLLIRYADARGRAPNIEYSRVKARDSGSH